MNKVSDIQLADNSVISLHAQLHNQLRHLIMSGRWAYGSRIPSENQLTSHLKISRSTIRLALQQAELEGLIERVAGRGTFVAYSHGQDRQQRLIAFVVADLDTENNLFMLNGAESKAREYGYRIIFHNVRNLQDECHILSTLGQDNVDGILLWPCSAQTDTHYYENLHVPVVMMDRLVAGYDCDLVTSDNYGGGRQLMQHLLGLGHQRIVFASHHQFELLPVAERYRAYCDALREAGLPQAAPWLVGEPDSEMSMGRVLRSTFDYKSPELRQFQALMAQANPQPTAIFAMNDYIAILTLRALKLMQIPVPHVISVAGFDDSYLAANLEVPLTTVAQDSFMIGKCAAALLLQRLEGYTGPSRQKTIPTQLRIRSSTAVFEQVAYKEGG